MARQCDLVWLLRVSQLLRPYLLPQSLRQVHDVLSAAESVPPISDSEVQSCPWVGLTHGLGWVGSGHTKWTRGQLCRSHMRSHDKTGNT